MLKRLSLVVAVASLLIAPLAAVAQSEIVITNPELCDFDNDGIADEWTTEGRDGFAVLSKNNKTKKVKMNRAFVHFTCRDTNDDDKAEIIGRLREGGRVKQTLFVSGGGNAALLKVCKSLRELQRCEIWKSQQSDHISRGDPRHRSTGFITTRNCPGGFPNPVVAYDSKGAKIHQLGEYFPTGSAYDSRYYGCFAAGDCKSPVSIAQEASRKTGKEEIYLKDLSGACARVPDPGQCYNSSGC